MTRVLLPKDISLYLLEPQDLSPWDTVAVHVKTRGRYIIIDTVMPDAQTLIKYVFSSNQKEAAATLTSTLYIGDKPVVDTGKEIVLKEVIGTLLGYQEPYYYIASVKKGYAKYIEVFRIIAKYNKDNLLEKYTVEKVKQGEMIGEETLKRIATLKI